MLKNFNVKLFAAVCSVNLLSFATGNVYSWSSSVLITLKSSDPEINPLGHVVEPLSESLIVSLLSFGAICGPLMAGFFSNLLGRKTTLMLFSLPMLLSNLILMFATTTTELFVARFMAGLGAGCVYTVIPIYVGEIAETNVRGFLGGFMGIFYVLGLLFVYVVGPFVNLQNLSAMLILPIILFMILFGMFVPESPYYYFSEGKPIYARKSLMKLRKSLEEKELALIEETITESKSMEISFYSLFQNKSFKKALMLTTTIVTLQQLSGITAILAYMENIFIASGSEMSSSTSTIIVAVIQVCMVIISSCLADKWGRRILLIISSAVCALALFPLGLYFFLKHSGNDVSGLWYLPISCIITFIVGYNFGLCTVPWTLTGELFTNQTKAIASSTTTVTCFTMAFLMSLLFPHLEKLVGFHGVFWFCGCMALTNLLFVSYFLPETKGKSFVQILRILENDVSEKDSYETLKMSSVVTC